MKTLKCLLIVLFAVIQLNAQIKDSAHQPVNRTDTIIVPIDTAALQPDMSAPNPDTEALHIDTIALVQSYLQQKDFQKADTLLTRYGVSHIDMETLTFHAQVLYWMKAFDRSTAMYEKALDLYPAPSAHYLAYARVLYSLNRLSKARQLLKAYSHYDSSNAEAVIMTAYIDLWNGKTALAIKEAKLLLQKYPENAEAKNIITQAGYYTIPSLKTKIELFSDDQPIKGQVYAAEAGVYKSWLFAPAFHAAVYRFQVADSSFHSLWLQLANTVQLGKNTKAKLQGGVFQQNGSATALTGSLDVSRKLARDFSVQVAFEKRPYQFAAGSIRSVVMENASAISLSYNRNNKWLGKAAYEHVQYKDANKIHIAYLWALAPLVMRPHFALSAGYSFRYADALKNTFVSRRTVPELIAASQYSNIAGIYTPYFTPEKQVVHAVLASAKVIPAKNLEFTSRISIGVIGKADNPYLWLDKSGSHYAFNKGYAAVEFMQSAFVNEVRLSASKKLSVTAAYSYDKLLYYTSHKGSIELKYLLF